MLVYERINQDAWQAISSCRFKNVVFERNGRFEKYQSILKNPSITKNFPTQILKNWIIITINLNLYSAHTIKVQSALQKYS